MEQLMIIPDTSSPCSCPGWRERRRLGSRMLLLVLLALLGPAGCPRTEPLSRSSQDPIFHGADRYDFAIIVAAGTMECFWQFAQQNGNFFFSYEVQRATGIGNNRNILVTASDPSGFQLGASQHVRGQINFLTKEKGSRCPSPAAAPSLPRQTALPSALMGLVTPPSPMGRMRVKCWG